MRDGLRLFGVALAVTLVLGVLVHCCASVAEAQETVYADKVAVGTPYPAPSASPLTVVGLPTGQSGGILRAGTGGLVGIGPLVVGDIPGVFTRRDVAETINAGWTFAVGVNVNAPGVVLGPNAAVSFTGTNVGPPTNTTRSPGTRLVLYPALSATTYDFGIGIDNGLAWFSLPSSQTNLWRFYADDTTRAAAATPPETPNSLVAELTGARTFMPGAPYSGRLGLPARKWLTVSAGELQVETLNVIDTLASTNGRQLIGASATVLTRDLPTEAGPSWLYVKAPAFLAGDRVLLESSGKVEWLGVGSNAIDCTNTTPGTQPCAATGADWGYTVYRNLDGSGANTFYAGDAAFNSGQTGDGYLDLFALRSTVSNGYPGYVLGDRPWFYYRMEYPDAANPARFVDASGHGNHGATFGVIAYRGDGGLIGSGVDLPDDGIATLRYDSAIYPSGPNAPGGTGGISVPRGAGWPYLAGDLTVSFVVLPHAGGAGDYQVIAETTANVGEFYLARHPGDNWLYLLQGDGGGTNWDQLRLCGPLPNDVVTFAAVTRNSYSREVRCYFNGTLQSVTPYTTAVIAPGVPQPLLIGAHAVGIRNWVGYLDEVAIYPYVLPADRIAAQYARRGSNSWYTGATNAGPTVAVMQRQSNGYNDIRPRAMFGNLNGEYGFTETTPGMAIGDPTAANLIATASKLAFRDGVVETLVIRGDSFAMGSPSAPTGLNTGAGIWFSYSGPIGIGVPTFRVGIPDGNVVRWDGAHLLIREQGVQWDQYGIWLADGAGTPTAGRWLKFGGTASSTSVDGTLFSSSSSTFFVDSRVDWRVKTSNSGGSLLGFNLINSGGVRRFEFNFDAFPLGTPEVVPVGNVGASATLGSTANKWANVFLNLPNMTAAPYAVVTGTTPLGGLGYLAGFTGTKQMWSPSGQCAMTFQAGILTASTCP